MTNTGATLEREYSLAEGKRVAVQHLRGMVLVKSGEGQTVRVQVETPPGLDWEISPDEDGNLSIRSSVPEGTEAPEASCTVILPPRAGLRVWLVAGGLRLEGVETRARLDTVSADITLDAARGAFHLQTVSGDINARALDGALYVQSVSGDVHLTGCRLSGMQGRSLGGEFLVETPLLEGPYAFHTLSGDVILRLPPETHCDVDFRTLTGGMEIAFSGVYFPKEGAGRQVMVGDGGPQVKVETLSGKLWVMANPRIGTNGHEVPQMSANGPE
ncbi:MAG TPA: hypothetical protein ENJ02_10370 [Chloroflexi bacterium]|nr:hypothetical protein [Chloroflexota bacterium]